MNTDLGPDRIRLRELQHRIGVLEQRIATTELHLGEAIRQGRYTATMEASLRTMLAGRAAMFTARELLLNRLDRSS